MEVIIGCVNKIRIGSNGVSINRYLAEVVVIAACVVVCVAIVNTDYTGVGSIDTPLAVAGNDAVCDGGIAAAEVDTIVAVTIDGAPIVCRTVSTADILDTVEVVVVNQAVLNDDVVRTGYLQTPVSVVCNRKYRFIDIDG